MGLSLYTPPMSIDAMVTADALRDVDFNRMSLRARIYTGVAAARSVATAMVLLAMGNELGARVYPTVTALFTTTVWAHLWTAVGILLIVSAVRSSIFLARLGLIILATITSIWAVAVTITTSISIGDSGMMALVISPVLWWALVLKDLVVLRQPLVSPFEELAKRYPVEGKSPSASTG
jgi:hypothetical protein